MSKITYIPPGKQAYVDSAFPNGTSNIFNNNYLAIGPARGGSVDLFSGYDTYFNQGNLTTWLSFPLHSIPKDATINSVKLQIIVDGAVSQDYGDCDFYISKSSTSFSENTLTYNNAPNGSVSGTSATLTRLEDNQDSTYWATRGTGTYNGPLVVTLTTSDITNALSSNEIVYRITNNDFAVWSLLKDDGFKLIVNYTENSSTAAKLYYDGGLNTFDGVDERLPAVLDGLEYHYPLDFTDESTGTWNKNGNYATTGKKTIQDISHKFHNIEKGLTIRYSGLFRKSSDMASAVRFYYYYKRDGVFQFTNAGDIQSQIGTDWTFVTSSMVVATTGGVVTDGRTGVTVREGSYNEGIIEWKDCEIHIDPLTNTNPQYSIDGLGAFDATTNLIDASNGYSSYANAISDVDTPWLNGYDVFKVTRNVAVSNPHISYNLAANNTTSGLVYSATVKVYDPHNHISSHRLYNSTSDFTGMTSGSIQMKNGWRKLWAIGTSTRTGNATYFNVYNENAAVGDNFWISEPQLEQKSVPTEYVLGSRTLGVFNVTGSIGMDQCTIAFKHKVTTPTQSFPTIMNIGWYSDPIIQDGIAFYRGQGWNNADSIYLGMWCQATAAQPYSTTIVTNTADDLENHELYYVIAWETGSGTGTVGVRVKDLTTNTMLFTTDQTGKTFSWTHLPPLYLGTLNGGSHQQGWYKDLSVYDRALTSTELDKLVASPFQIQETITVANDGIKEEMYIPTGSHYWPLMNLSASLYDDKLPIECTNENYEETRGIFIGDATTNLLDTNYRNLVSAPLANATKTLIEPGKYRWVNDGNGFTNVRLYCLLTSLTNGTTYNCSIKYEDLEGTITMDWCDVTPTGTSSTTVRTVTGHKSYGKLSGYASRGTYDSAYRFMDVQLSEGTSVTLFEPQVEARNFETPFADATNSESSLEFDLTGSIGMDWSGDWTISYWKYPTGTSTATTLTGYSIESLGCNSNSVGAGYVFWGKTNGSNALFSTTPSTITPSNYFNHWHMVTLVKSGTTVTNTYRGIVGCENATRTWTLSGISSDYYCTQYGYDFKLGGWDNGNSNNSFFRDLVVAKRAFTEAEQDNLYNQMKVRLNDGVYIKQLKEKGI